MAYKISHRFYFHKTVSVCHIQTFKKLGSGGKLIFRVIEMDTKTLSASARLHGNILLFLELFSLRSLFLKFHSKSSYCISKI